MKSLRKSLKKLLELINGFSKFAGRKSNISKLILFPYISPNHLKEIKETIPFVIASRRIKTWE